MHVQRLTHTANIVLNMNVDVIAVGASGLSVAAAQS